MSPRGNSSSTPSSSTNPRSAPPYTRRPAGQPKSSRQQFSACGACRMRRVRCDLKDLPFTSTSPHPACSNCKERGLKCVDEFADVKAVKLLRRGRRLQQVEALYGKVVGPDGTPSTTPTTRLPSIIPQLQVEFFSSPFWHWFCIQRPVLDPVEFSARFFAHVKGVHSLGNEGGLLTMILVVWAASFGVDERGMPENENTGFTPSESDVTPGVSGRSGKKGNDYGGSDRKPKEITPERKRKERKETTEAMLREVLELVDFHGIMRRPTLDGVRVLLLILPLMEEAHPLERLAMYEATLSQTQALCTLGFPPSDPSPSFNNVSDDAVVRARIFWYAHMHEGISTGMQGGRLVLNNDDFEAFQRTLPPMSYVSNPQGLPSPPSVHGSLPPNPGHSLKPQQNSSTQAFAEATKLFSIPLQISAVCRKVHLVLTGPKATRRAEEHGLIDAHGMREIWDDLDHCWHEFEIMRRNSLEHESFDTERFVSAWQIYIFECHNIIRESLKQCMSTAPSVDNSNPSILSASSPRPSSHSSNSSPYLSPHHLHTIATRKCLSLLPSILHFVKYHLTRAERGLDAPGLFEWDAGLIRDGCFFAGFLAAGFEGDTIDPGSDDPDDRAFNTEEGVALCLTALSAMKWAFSKSEEREETVRMVWENRKLGRHSRYRLSHHDLSRPGYSDHPTPSGYSKGHPESHSFMPVPGLEDRPLLPPLNLLRSPRRTESAPNTAATIDGHGANGWPTYTPPGTATSVTTSTGTGVNSRGSPIFASMAGPISYKGDVHDSFYHASGDLDQFSFSAPMTGPGVNSSAVSYHPRAAPAPSMHSTPSVYLDTGAFAVSGAAIAHSNSDINSCPQFGDDCNNGYYH